jgi:class 3 adenylate cyclase
VVVGDLAGGGVLDRDQVAGETPNLASRLQGAAEPGQNLIADSTRRLAGHAFEADHRPGRPMKAIVFDHIRARRVRGDSSLRTQGNRTARRDGVSKKSR